MKGRLEAEEIQVYIDYQHHILGDWSIAQALEGVQLRVHPEEFELAWQVMQAHNRGDFELDEDDAEEPVCPRCREHRHETVVWPVRLALLMVFITRLPIPYTRRRHRCEHCGLRWTGPAFGEPMLIIAMFLTLILPLLVLVASLISLDCNGYSDYWRCIRYAH